MDEKHPEIVIIKRHASHEEEHHGGAWKIAFADFMTAMMAFFMVLWIINATDKDTKTVIARYFNPVKLEEPSRTRKGVQGFSSEASSGAASAGEGEAAGPAAEPPKDADITGANPIVKASATPGAPMALVEGAIFKDPYATLQRIIDSESDAGDRAAIHSDAESSLGNERILLDPFRPLRREAKEAGATPGPSARPDKAGTESKTAAPREGPGPEPAPPGVNGAQPGAKGNERTDTGQKPPEPSGSAANGNAADAAGSVDLAKLRAELARLSNGANGQSSGPGIDVRKTSEGTLISLTDQASFSMFSIGLAQPQPNTIRLMAEIARLLKNQAGKVVVRGHTDGRPFTSPNYDNWRLSSARAQMSYYMLVRGGLTPDRVERIEGHADRSLRIPGDPLAAQNRRIEILLRNDSK